ncbi:MAG: LytTR family DNA-binding domain-containing protein [Burkholderiales bacterium]
MTARAVWRVPLALATVWTLVNAAVNSASVANDLARRGVAFKPAEPWIWECSSALGLLLWLVPVLLFDARLRARVRTLWARTAAYAGASMVFSLGHVLTMVALRQVAYRIAGWRYDFGPWVDGLVYEYRKDALTFVAILAVAAVWRLWVERAKLVQPETPALPSASPPAAPTFIVRTATQGDLLVRADEVDWVEAQGNYVALHVGSEVRLLRHTLAEMQTRLKDHGFIRTHRRALVNRLRMQAIIPPELGELGVRLSSGQVAPLSESRRAEVLRLVLGA